MSRTIKNRRKREKRKGEKIWRDLASKWKYATVYPVAFSPIDTINPNYTWLPPAYEIEKPGIRVAEWQ